MISCFSEAAEKCDEVTVRYGTVSPRTREAGIRQSRRVRKHPESVALAARFLSALAWVSAAFLPCPSLCGANTLVPTTEASRYAIPATDDGLPGAGPVRRQDWFRKHWLERRSAWAGETARDRQAIVFLGDSITEGWGGTLQHAFPRLKVANRGISGDTTRGVLLRLQDDVLALDPAAVILLIGTNDLEEGAQPAIAVDNVALILDAMGRHNPTLPIILCQVFPSSVKKNRPAELIRAINAGYLELARNRQNVIYLETWSMFANVNGDAKPEEFPDLLHPNQAGYEKWAAALRPIIATLNLADETSEEFLPEDGFVSLFNGRDLTGWCYRPVPSDVIATARRRDASIPRAPVRVFPTERLDFENQIATPEGRYRAQKGRLIVTTPPEYRKIQQLWTTREFPRDFVLRMEFRATPNAGGGVLVRGPQLQVGDYLVAGPYRELKNYLPQEWNKLEMTVRGDRAIVTCNGEVLEAGFAVPASGPIGIEGDRGQVEYRRIRLRTLD